VSKDKKKKKKNKKKADGSIAAVGKGLKSISENPLVADVVAAALVATAAALKDSNKARQLASEAGDDLSKLSKKGAEQGNVMWQLALEIGQRTLETLAGEEAGRIKSRAGSGRKAK
jgi:hypothetical protein